MDLKTKVNPRSMRILSLTEVTQFLMRNTHLDSERFVLIALRTCIIFWLNILIVI